MEENRKPLRCRLRLHRWGKWSQIEKCVRQGKCEVCPATRTDDRHKWSSWRVLSLSAASCLCSRHCPECSRDVELSGHQWGPWQTEDVPDGPFTNDASSFGKVFKVSTRSC